MTQTVKVKEAIENAQGNDDLWNQLDEAMKEVAAREVPPNGFCSRDYQQHYHLSKSQSQYKIRKLREAGKVEPLGRFGNATYYGLVKP